MRHLIIAIFIVVFAFNLYGQKPDTVLIQKQNLDFKYLQTGNSSYLIYFKKTETSIPERMMLVKMNVEPTVVNGKKAFAIKQEWDSGDEVVHTSYTLHNADDFSTLRQEAWWKQWGYTAKFDFITKQVTFDGPVTDATKSRIVEAFNESFASYNLCWHSDLTIFPMFPYKDGRVIKVNFYDPGGSLKSQIAEYTISGSELLTGSNGQKIDCWIMDFSYKTPSGDSGTQRFWISKQTREVLKEEDRFNGGFRYKMKIGISGER